MQWLIPREHMFASWNIWNVCMYYGYRANHKQFNT